MNQSFHRILVCAGFMALGVSATTAVRAQTNQPTSATAWLTRPLSLVDALNTVLIDNATILKAQNDLDATYGLVVQTRAVALPRLQATGNYTSSDPKYTEAYFPGQLMVHQNWASGIQVVQSIYEGGRVGAALRAAKLTKEQALLQYQTVVADTLLNARIAYYQVLVAQQQILVNEASVSLLTKELEDQKRRYEAGTVPRFNVLRAEVAVANARPPLIRARNAYRIAKNNLSNLLGYNLPAEVWEDIPLQLTDKLDDAPYQIDLPVAIRQALERRTELAALRKSELLQKENITNAKAGYKPSVQVFAGYNWANSMTNADLSRYRDGWAAGAQVTWNIFDGMATRGRVIEAQANHEKSQVELADAARRIELEVRTAYSTFIDSWEVLESQKKVQEEAEEALRLANARADAGTSTQLDVLDAETQLTQARTTQSVALYEYNAARARLERAIGMEMVQRPAAR